MNEILEQVRLTKKQSTILVLLWPRRGGAGKWTPGPEIAQATGAQHAATSTIENLKLKVRRAGWTIESSHLGYRMRKLSQ